MWISKDCCIPVLVLINLALNENWIKSLPCQQINSLNSVGFISENGYVCTFSSMLVFNRIFACTKNALSFLEGAPFPLFLMFKKWVQLLIKQKWHCPHASWECISRYRGLLKKKAYLGRSREGFKSCSNVQWPQHADWLLRVQKRNKNGVAEERDSWNPEQGAHHVENFAADLFQNTEVGEP